MSRRLARVIAFALVLVMLCTGVCFAAPAEIVSPAQSAVTESDSFLISVKLPGAGKVRISVFRELESVEVTKTVSGTAVKLIELASPDLSGLNADDVAAITDVYTGAVTKGAVLSNGKTAVKYTGSEYLAPVVYENKTDGIGIYTKQLSSVDPGLYRVKVDTLGKDDKVSSSAISLILVKAKPKDKDKADLFETNQSSAAQTIKTVIKTLFK